MCSSLLAPCQSAEPVSQPANGTQTRETNTPAKHAARARHQRQQSSAIVSDKCATCLSIWAEYSRGAAFIVAFWCGRRVRRAVSLRPAGVILGPDKRPIWSVFVKRPSRGQQVCEGDSGEFLAASLLSFAAMNESTSAPSTFGHRTRLMFQ